MLSNRFDAWLADAVQKGMEKGIEEGIKKGIEKGRKEGRKEGRKKGHIEGREEGRKEGEQQGYNKASIEVLLKQLKLKFGNVLPEITQHIQQMPHAEIMLCIERVLTAASLDEVLQLE